VQALQAGKHVFVEKPMALRVQDCDRMLAAAAQARKLLMVGHVLRFWPEYTVAAEVVSSGQYGKLRSLLMSRHGAAPHFGARDWFMDHTKSGGALLDLHIHDVDFTLGLLGMPKAVQAAGRTGPSGGYDHVMCSYDYGPAGPMVHAEASWTPGKDSPFVMAFRMELERATLLYSSNAQPTLGLFDEKGRPKLKAPEGSGYLREIQHFIECIRKGVPSSIAPPISARNSLAVAMAEAKSIRTGRMVRF
jgi:predicted dehydrogenase